MIKPLSISLLLASLALAGCVETSATKTGQTPSVTGGDLAGVPAGACRAAIAKTMNRPVSDVTVFAVKESAAGSQVEASVTGAEAPWRCTTDGSGRVSSVMYTGSEGRL
jgi:glucose/arabinose dehydrogenase